MANVSISQSKQPKLCTLLSDVTKPRDNSRESCVLLSIIRPSSNGCSTWVIFQLPIKWWTSIYFFFIPQLQQRKKEAIKWNQDPSTTDRVLVLYSHIPWNPHLRLNWYSKLIHRPIFSTKKHPPKPKKWIYDLYIRATNHPNPKIQSFQDQENPLTEDQERSPARPSRRPQKTHSRATLPSSIFFWGNAEGASAAAGI